MPSSALLFPGQGSHAEGMDEPYRGSPLFERGLELLGYDPFEQPRRGHPLPAARALPVLGRRVGRVARGGRRGGRGARRRRPLARRVRRAGRRRRAAVRGRRRGSSTSAPTRWPTPASATPAAWSRCSAATVTSVRALASRLGLVVANDNAPGQLVLSGAVDALDEAEDVARDEAGARARRLDVTGAFHSPLMEPAADRLRAALEATPIAEPQHPRLLQRQRGALRRRAPRAGREPAAPRALARDAAGAAHRAHRALRRARPRRGPHRPRQANPSGGCVSMAATAEHTPTTAIAGAWRPSAGAA